MRNQKSLQMVLWASLTAAATGCGPEGNYQPPRVRDHDAVSAKARYCEGQYPCVVKHIIVDGNKSGTTAWRGREGFTLIDTPLGTPGTCVKTKQVLEGEPGYFPHVVATLFILKGEPPPEERPCLMNTGHRYEVRANLADGRAVAGSAQFLKSDPNSDGGPDTYHYLEINLTSSSGTATAGRALAAPAAASDYLPDPMNTLFRGF